MGVMPVARTLATAAACVAVSPVFAQATVPTFKASKPPFPAISAKQWVGEKIVFQRAFPQDRAHAYKTWSTAPAEGEVEETFYPKRVPYDDLAGKTATIKSLYTRDDFLVATVEMDGTGKRYRGLTYTKTLPDVVFLRDIESAKKAYVGKSLWVVTAMMTTDEIADKPGMDRYLPVPNFEKVTVMDVLPGAVLEQPVQIVFKMPEGIVGYYPVWMSRTNVTPGDTVPDSATFEGSFIDYDPHARYPFSPAIWKAITEKKVVKGMTPLQVVMSYYTPDAVKKPANVTQGDLVYVYTTDIDGIVATRRIFFKNGRVIADKYEEKKAVKAGTKR